MPPRDDLSRAAAAVAWTLVSVLAAESGAGIDHQLSGRFSIESRWFPEEAAFPGQGSHAGGVAATPQLYLEDAAGRSLTLAPFLRYDSADRRRTRADLREAYLLFFGEIGDGEWELRLGVGQVFWGVAESRHLVDIINQVDFVEHPDGESRLGQPMAHLTWSGDWGALELFGLPWHRARTFPGRSGRLRLPLVVDEDRVEYESGSGARHLDLAARYSHGIGPLDLGVSLFRGTSREPWLRPAAEPEGAPVLTQHYGQIRQLGLDGQWTAGAWLLKLEAIQCAGARNRLGREGDYVASVLGAEYTFYSTLGSPADLSLLGEWNYDGRGSNAVPRRTPDTLQNDLFVAGRLALNDVQGTEVRAGLAADLERSTRTLVVELNRRLSGRWAARLEAVGLLAIDEEDLHYSTRRDSFVDLGLIYSL